MKFLKSFGAFFLRKVGKKIDFCHSLGILGLCVFVLAQSSFSEPAANVLPTGYQSAAGNVQFNKTGRRRARKNAE